MNCEQQEVAKIIRETVSVVCRNGLSHSVGVRVQGLIGITVDESDVFLVKIDDSYGTSVDSSVHSSQPDSASRPPKSTNAVETPVYMSKGPSTFSKIGQKSANLMSSAAGPVPFRADSDIITIPDYLDEADVKVEYGNLLYDDDIDTKPDSLYDAVHESSYDPACSSGVTKLEDVKPAANDFSGYADSYHYQSRFADTDFAEQLQPESFMETQNPQSAWQSQMYSYEQASVESNVRRTATMRRYAKQEYGNQPTQQLIRQRLQQQQEPGDNMVVVRSLHECGYPDCGRKFQQRCHLLHHQTQKHGRKPHDRDPDSNMVVVRSLHECGYPDCGRKFQQRCHLLHHQTQKHGRKPTRVQRLQKVWVKPDDDFDDSGNY